MSTILAIDLGKFKSVACQYQPDTSQHSVSVRRPGSRWPPAPEQDQATIYVSLAIAARNA